jgi:2-hydroxychromene-2-carboxylate isomerase
MGELIHLDQWRTSRLPTPSEETAFFLDIGCPLSYLTAERIERRLGKVTWVPVSSAAVRDDEHLPVDLLREQAEARARALRLPLVWPERFPAETRCALRAVTQAAELGAGAQFALAASRLAFCGGFDLEDPEALAEAAAAAGVPLEVCLRAAGDPERDEELERTAQALSARGISELPAFRVGRRWFEGEKGLLAAEALLQRPLEARRPLAPLA